MSRLAALSPFGPIFGKELRTASRRRRNYVLRVVYLGGLLLFLLLAYTITNDRYGYQGAAARMQQQEQLGQLFFLFFSMFCVIAMGLIGAVLTSTAINGERLHKTLHVLLMTPLTAWQIVSGKLFSRLLTALTLIGLSLPVLALVRLLGGVELQQMFGVLALCATTALTSAALGLLLSVLVRRAYAVILLAYLLMGFAYLFVPMVAALFLSASGAGGQMRWMAMIARSNPFFCTGFLASGERRIMINEWVPCVLIHLGVTAVLLVLSAILVRRMARREGEGASTAAAAAALPPLRETGSLIAAPAGSREAVTAAGRAHLSTVGAARHVSDSPVLWRELRRPLMASRWQRTAGAVLCILLLVTMYVAVAANDGLDDNDVQMGFAIVFHALVMLLACVIAGTAIAQEKEGDTWTVLLASPLGGADIVFGKAIGAARRLLWPIVLVAGHFLVFTITGVISLWSLLLALVVITSFNAIWIASGIYLSLRCRKVTAAVIINLALPVVLYGVVSLLLLVLGEMTDQGDNLAEHVAWYLPFYYLGEAMDRTDSRPRLPGDWQSVTGGQFLMTAIVFGLLHLAVASAILWWTAARFNAIVGRAPQVDPLPPARPRFWDPGVTPGARAGGSPG